MISYIKLHIIHDIIHDMSIICLWYVYLSWLRFPSNAGISAAVADPIVPAASDSESDWSMDPDEARDYADQFAYHWIIDMWEEGGGDQDVTSERIRYIPTGSAFNGAWYCSDGARCVHWWHFHEARHQNQAHLLWVSYHIWYHCMISFHDIISIIWYHSVISYWIVMTS